MEDQELTQLTTQSIDQMTDEYNRILAVYRSYGVGEGAAKDSSPLEDLTNFFSIIDESSRMAYFHARDMFNIRDYHRAPSSTYGASNYFESTNERKSRQILLDALNIFIRKLEVVRGGKRKIGTLYCYLISRGLYNLLNEIYVPDYYRDAIDKINNQINIDIDTLIKEIEDHFKTFNNEKLNIAVHSLGTFLLSYRSDKIIESLQNFDNRIDGTTDREFLQERRTKYLEFSKGPKLKYAQDLFEVPSTSYYSNLNNIISNLTEILDQDSIDLLTNLFIKD